MSRGNKQKRQMKKRKIKQKLKKRESQAEAQEKGNTQPGSIDYSKALTWVRQVGKKKLRNARLRPNPPPPLY